MLDFWEKKFNVPYQTFIPKDEIQIASIPHETTITEDWDCADSDSLNCDLTWTELQSDTDIVSNVAVSQAGSATTSTARADSDLSTDDHYSQAILNRVGGSSGNGQDYGTIVRKDDTTTITFYHGRIGTTAAPDVLQLFKLVTGTSTQLGSNVEQAASLPDTVKTQADGSTITFYFNDVEKFNETDTAITGNLRTGIRNRHITGWVDSTNGKASFNDFQSEDLSASSHQNLIQGVSTIQGVSILN